MKIRNIWKDVEEPLELHTDKRGSIVDLFYNELREALLSGDSIKLTGFGNFQIREKSERPGRNPKTGQEIPISARKVVTFHASQKLKERMQKNN